jgi:hypothetical protein
MTTLEVPQEWQATFERATSTEEWDRILKYCQRLPNNVYFAARKACAGRDSRSQKIAATRHRAADFLDSI